MEQYGNTTLCCVRSQKSTDLMYYIRVNYKVVTLISHQQLLCVFSETSVWIGTQGRILFPNVIIRLITEATRWVSTSQGMDIRSSRLRATPLSAGESSGCLNVDWKMSEKTWEVKHRHSDSGFRRTRRISALFYIYFVDRASRYKFLLMTNLTHILCIYLFHLSTCFEHQSAHYQEVELY
jgi:hypothetical protein